MKFHYDNGALFAEITDDGMVHLHHRIMTVISPRSFKEHVEMMNKVSEENDKRIAERDAKENISAL